MSNNDTICAPATSYGTAAISIIRLSGKECFRICDKIVTKKISLNKQPAGIYLLKVSDKNGQVIVEKIIKR